jgi:hypothetical protein
VIASIARNTQDVHGRPEKVKSPQTEAVDNSPNVIARGIQAVHGRPEKVKSPQTEVDKSPTNGRCNLIVSKMSDHAHIHSSVKMNIKLRPIK